MEERGPKTPGENLESAVKLLHQVKDAVGFGTASRETIARAAGYSSLNGRSNRVIASLVHFGFLDRSGAAALRISELGKRVLMPTNDEERTLSIAEAVRRPAFYDKLFARFGGHALPSMLPHILVREFGVLPNSSEKVAEIFRSSAAFAGMLRNGVLQTEPEPAEPSIPHSQAVPDSRPSESQPTAAPAVLRVTQTPVSGAQRYTIPLDAQGRLATIDLPVPLSASDLRRVVLWANFMAAVSTNGSDSAGGETLDQPT